MTRGRWRRSVLNQAAIRHRVRCVHQQWTVCAPAAGTNVVNQLIKAVMNFFAAWALRLTPELQNIFNRDWMSDEK